MTRVLRALRGVEGVTLIIAVIALLDAMGASVPAPALVLGTGVVYAATRGGRVPATVALLASAAALIVLQTDHLSRSDTIAWVVTYVITAGTIAVIVSDLASRAGRSAEAERVARERGESVEDAKAAFLKLASHELRGPIGIISGYLDLLRHGNFGPIDAADIRVAEPVMRVKVQEMQVLVDSLLETARLEEVSLTLRRRRLDIRDLVDMQLAAIRPMATPHHDIRWERPSAPFFVDGDAARLGLIIGGLLQNAVRYSPDGGIVQLFLSSTDTQMVLSVWDHGLGIAEADLDTLFTRFGRVVTPANAHISGIGLGLYLARELARLHGGDVQVVSAAGRGSTFTLILPLAVDAAPPAAVSDPAPVREPLRSLVVDAGEEVGLG